MTYIHDGVIPPCKLQLGRSWVGQEAHDGAVLVLSGLRQRLEIQLRVISYKA